MISDVKGLSVQYTQYQGVLGFGRSLGIEGRERIERVREKEGIEGNKRHLLV